MFFAQYVAVFRCRAIVSPDNFRMESGSVAVEFKRGPIELGVLRQVSRVNVFGSRAPAPETASDVLVADQLKLPRTERYLVLTARASELGQNTLQDLEQQIDRVIAQLSLLISPQVFMELVFRGPQQGKKVAAGVFVRPAKAEEVIVDDLTRKLQNLERARDTCSERWQQFDLMSRFYTKALAYDPNEERFMMLWTILEIYPMQDQTNVKPIEEMMARVSGRSVSEVKEVLKIGKLHGIRSKLVHSGTFDAVEYRDAFRRLEILAHEAMREVIGLPYGNGIEIYQESKNIEAEEAKAIKAIK